jgi:Fe-S cluster biogenesis protein NfuA
MTWCEPASDHESRLPGDPAARISLHDRVERIINLIRPAVQSDGGDLELVSVGADGIVHVRFHGACVGCPSSTMTLQTGIERNLRQHVPEVRGVLAVN